MTPNLTASSSPTDDKPQTPSAPPSPRPNTDQAIPRHHPAAPPHVAPTLEPASAHHAQAPAPVSSPADLASAPTPTPAPNHPSHMPPPPPSSSSVSSFRNVSACNRCRLRKNRCDQRLPACASCEKAHVKCVGYDPITKKEIPRRCVTKSLLYAAGGAARTAHATLRLDVSPESFPSASRCNMRSAGCGPLRRRVRGIFARRSAATCLSIVLLHRVEPTRRQIPC